VPSLWWALAALVALRFLFHVVFIPVFEGPDEPFHLARARAFAMHPATSWFRGSSLDTEVIASIRAHPCGPDLKRVFGCLPFRNGGATAAPHAATLVGYPNYENNQPPLYYAVAGAFLAIAGALPGSLAVEKPEGQLYVLRILSACFLLLAVFGPLRRLASPRGPSSGLTVLALLVFPGAAEALVRCSNDALLFLWAAAIVCLADSRRWNWLAVGLPFGMLIKLTALPIVVVGLVRLLRRRSARAFIVAGVLAAFPVLVLRGWVWGGAVPLGPQMPPVAFGIGLITGFARSIYTILKTTLWLGEWSFFRAPVWLLAPLPLLLGAWLVRLRWRRRPRERSSHVAGLTVAAVGVVVFFLANRSVFGVWGGVPGWYLWGWLPWLAVAAGDLLELPRRPPSWLLAVSATYLLIFNVVWFVTATQRYHSPGLVPKVLPARAGS
jgi:hypothetical protein